MAFKTIQDAQLSLGNLQDEMNRLIERVWHSGVSTGPFDGQQWGPVLDVYEHDDAYLLFAELPGVDGADVEVTVLNNTLTVRGEKRRPETIGENDRPVRGERRFGSFNRSIDLPADIDADGLTAKCHAGVLDVRIPKLESSKPKSVKIDIDEG